MTTTNSPRRARSRTKVRRRLSGLLALGVALVGAGALYSALVPTPQTAHASGSDAAQQSLGKQLYENTCITCHGANLQGEKDRGPTLIGVGSAAVYFQVSTGRMPLDGQSAQAVQRQSRFTTQQIDAIGAYIEAHGGGPLAPTKSDAELSQGNPAQGGELFRLNCASCHNFTGQGGALSSGKAAPSLQSATPSTMYTAMLSGPGNMPKFSDRQLTPQEKQNIISYVTSVQNGNNDPGGDGLGGLGPISEGFIAWVVGIAALVGVTLWIGAKA
ncbi:MAG TPA: c-type cytochrome [Pseudonocardiaceae bacterium]|jgi:ubiquinol-cytochrome c reductase cytochrome c subunit|nr:c-type cytochrome [Pseudonocardiaceae bacterium]